MKLKQQILLLESKVEVPKYRYRLQRRQRYFEKADYQILMERLAEVELIPE